MSTLTVRSSYQGEVSMIKESPLLRWYISLQQLCSESSSIDQREHNDNYTGPKFIQGTSISWGGFSHYWLTDSGGSYRDAETLEMSVKAGKLAKLLASRNYQQQYQSEYERRNKQRERRVITAILNSPVPINCLYDVFCSHDLNYQFNDLNS